MSEQIKERPILFSGAMVRALLDGGKTQTRRALGHQVTGTAVMKMAGARHAEIVSERGVRMPGWDCPYGQPGDRLWVRETFGYVSPDEFERPHAECNIEYRADLPAGCTDRPGQWPAEECAGDPARPRWRPSIHMPRWASRILLEVVSVHVERLQDITEAEAAAEGVLEWARGACAAGNPLHLTNVGYFSKLWEHTYGPGSWHVNPWVWVIDFKRVAP